MNPDLTSPREAPLRKTGTAGGPLLADIVSSLPKLSSDMSDSTPLERTGLAESLNQRVRPLKLHIEGSEDGFLNHLMDSGAMELIDLVVVESHERQMPHLLEATNALRARTREEGLEGKIRLDRY